MGDKHKIYREGFHSYGEINTKFTGRISLIWGDKHKIYRKDFTHMGR